MHSRKIIRSKEKKLAYNEIWSKTRGLEDITDISINRFLPRFQLHCKRAKQRQESFIAEFHDVLKEFEHEEPSKTKILKTINDVQEFMDTVHNDLTNDIEKNFKEFEETKAWENQDYLGGQLRNMHFYKQGLIDNLDDYIELSWTLVQDIIEGRHDKGYKENNSTDQTIQPKVTIKKRKPIDFSIQELEDEKDNDKDEDYVTNVPNIPSASRRFMPNRACKSD